MINSGRIAIAEVVPNTTTFLPFLSDNRAVSRAVRPHDSAILTHPDVAQGQTEPGPCRVRCPLSAGSVVQWRGSHPLDEIDLERG